MNCFGKKRQGRREEMTIADNPTGVQSNATSATATATASSFVQLQGACSKTLKSGRSFANGKRSASGVSGWRATGQIGVVADATHFSAAKLRRWLMWLARIVHTTIQHKGSRQGCTTDFVTASLTKEKSLANKGKKMEGLIVPEGAPVCKQADSLRNPCAICVEIYKLLFWPLFINFKAWSASFNGVAACTSSLKFSPYYGP